MISFFEEFPTGLNLRKISLIPFPIRLYVAAKSVRQFRKLAAGIRNKKVLGIIYWPLIKKEEGYWLSPFSERKALQRVFKELEGQKIPVMLDLELPTTRNPRLYLTQLPYFWRNKRLIQNFIGHYQGEIYLAEYYPEGCVREKLLEWLGLHYPRRKAKVIKMLYSSMHRFNLAQKLQQGKREWGDNFLAGLGVIAKGMAGDEAVLTPAQLGHDLKAARKAGTKEVVIFRLGGLNKEYVKVLSKNTHSKLWSFPGDFYS